MLELLRSQTYLFQISFPWLLLVVSLPIFEVSPYKEFPSKEQPFMVQALDILQVNKKIRLSDEVYW